MSIQQKHLLSLLQTGYTTIQIEFPDVGRGATEVDSPRGRAAPEIPPWQVATAYTKNDEFGSTRVMMRPPMPAMPQAPAPQLYTYKAKLADKIQPGDAVVVEVKGRLVLASVYSVDATPRIDTDASFEYKWIVQRVDLTAYRQNAADELAFQDTLQAIEREKQRAATLESFKTNLPEGSVARAMFDSAVANLQIGALAAPTPAPAFVPTQDNIGTVSNSEEGMQCR